MNLTKCEKEILDWLLEDIDLEDYRDLDTLTFEIDFFDTDSIPWNPPFFYLGDGLMELQSRGVIEIDGKIGEYITVKCSTKEVLLAYNNIFSPTIQDPLGNEWQLSLTAPE